MEKHEADAIILAATNAVQVDTRAGRPPSGKVLATPFHSDHWHQADIEGGGTVYVHKNGNYWGHEDWPVPQVGDTIHTDGTDQVHCNLYIKRAIKDPVVSERVKFNPCGDPRQKPWPDWQVGTRQKVKDVHNGAKHGRALETGWGIDGITIEVGDELELVKFVSITEAYCIVHKPSIGNMDTFKEAHAQQYPPPSTIEVKESTMNGKIYNGQVIRTRTVQAGEGVSAGTQVSEVLFSKNNIVAGSDAQAQLILSAAAARDLSLKDVKFDSPVEPIEVRVQVVVAS